jgi:hypothetical protein
MMSLGLFDCRVAVSAGLQQPSLDFEDPSGFVSRDRFQTLLLHRGARPRNSGLALVRSRFEMGLGGFERGLGFSEGGGADFIELLSGMPVLTFQSGELTIALLIRLAGSGRVRLETALQPIQQLEGLIQVQQVIHNLS